MPDEICFVANFVLFENSCSNADGSRSLPPMMRFMKVSLPWIGRNSPQGYL